VQDRRQGRVVLAESERLADMTQAITAYVARRMVDREKALASDRDEPILTRPPEPSATPAPQGRLGLAFRILLEYLGIVALCVLLWMLARYGFEVWQSRQVP
jgi:hypothetical protein